MKKINMKQMRVFTDSYREKYLLVDMSKGFMNAIYASLPSSSITRSLLQRIRESEGEIEITSAEESVLLSLVGGVDEECGVMRDVVDEAYNEMENVNKQE